MGEPVLNSAATPPKHCSLKNARNTAKDGAVCLFFTDLAQIGNQPKKHQCHWCALPLPHAPLSLAWQRNSNDQRQERSPLSKYYIGKGDQIRCSSLISYMYGAWGKAEPRYHETSWFTCLFDRPYSVRPMRLADLIMDYADVFASSRMPSRRRDERNINYLE